MNMEARVPGQPGLDLGGVAVGVVVAHQVHTEVGGHGLVDADQELPELHRPVAVVQFADDGAVGDVEGREQAGDALASKCIVISVTPKGRSAGQSPDLVAKANQA